ncbi:hypothetical protein MRX96_001080 [Rhipicephalus microplus]
MVQKYASDNQVMFSMSVKINKYLYKLILEHGESPNQSRNQEYRFVLVLLPVTNYCPVSRIMTKAADCRILGHAADVFNVQN